MKNRGNLSVVVLMLFILVLAFGEYTVSKCYQGYQIYENIMKFNREYQHEFKAIKNLKRYLKEHDQLTEEFMIDDLKYFYSYSQNKIFFSLNNHDFVVIIANKMIEDYYIAND